MCSSYEHTECASIDTVCLIESFTNRALVWVHTFFHKFRYILKQTDKISVIKISFHNNAGNNFLIDLLEVLPLFEISFTKSTGLVN